MLCLVLLTNSLFISNIILHHAQCSLCVGFPNSMFTSFFNDRAMLSGEIALKNNHYYYEQLVMWLECRLLDTGVDGLNPGISMLCP